MVEKFRFTRELTLLKRVAAEFVLRQIVGGRGDKACVLAPK